MVNDLLTMFLSHLGIGLASLPALLPPEVVAGMVLEGCG